MATPIKSSRTGAALAKVKTGARAAGSAVAKGARRVGSTVASGARRGASATVRGAGYGIRMGAKGTAAALKKAKWPIFFGGLISGAANETLWGGVATRVSSSDMGDGITHGLVGLASTAASGGATFIPGSFRRIVESLGGVLAGFGAGQGHEAMRLLRRSWSKGSNPEAEARAKMRAAWKQLRLQAKQKQQAAQLPAAGVP